MTAATSLSRLEPNIPRAYFDYALRSVIRTRDAIVDATAPFQREQRHLWRRQSQSPRMLWLASSVAGSAGGFGKYLFSFKPAMASRVVRTTISSGSRVKVCRTRSRFAGMLSPLGLGLGFGRRPGKKRISGHEKLLGCRQNHLRCRATFVSCQQNLFASR